MTHPAHDTHRCPRKGCTATVSNRLFACYDDWRALTRETQREIHRTARMSVLSTPRRNAFQMAYDDWSDADEQAERDAN